MIFALSRDRESAHKIIDRVLSLLLVRYSLVFSGCLSTIYLLFCKKYIFMLCRGSTVPSLAVVRVEGLKEMGMWKLPLAKDATNYARSNFCFSGKSFLLPFDNLNYALSG